MITLSAPALTQGQSFTCTSSYCEGAGIINVGIFKGLQTALNGLAQRLGLQDRVTVDGKIGQRTIDLLQLIAISVPINYASSLNTYWSTTKEEVARNAPGILAEIGLLFQRFPTSGSSMPGSTPAPSSGGAKSPTASWASIAPTLSPPPQQSGDAPIPHAPAKYLIAGLAGFGALVLGTVVFLTKRKSKSVGCASCR